MTTTHGFVGAFLGVAVATVEPALAPIAVIVGFLGGVLPDADLLATHRRTLHYPLLSAMIAPPVVLAALAYPAPEHALFAVFVLALAVHCVMDVFGGGVETRPWEATSELGVYNHLAGRWIRPRRWVRFAGAPEDFLLASAFALPTILVTTGRLQLGLATVLVASGLFVAVRRRLIGATVWLFGDTADDVASGPK